MRLLLLVLVFEKDGICRSGNKVKVRADWLVKLEGASSRVHTSIWYMTRHVQSLDDCCYYFCAGKRK